MKLVPEDRRPPNPKYVRPVYRDKTNLEVTDEHYWTNIRRALEESRFLIVLCSPNSARSKPVNMEVEHFLEVHGGDTSRVVPVIIGGDVVSTGENGALCPSLQELGDNVISRNLPNMVPDADIAEKDAWEAGFVALSSYLLKLERTAIGDHIQRETRRQTNALRGWLALTTVLTLAAAFIAFYAREKKIEEEIARNIAETKQVEAEHNLQRARHELGRVWLERAKRNERELERVYLASLALGINTDPAPDKNSKDIISNLDPDSPESKEALTILNTHLVMTPLWWNQTQSNALKEAVGFSPNGQYLIAQTLTDNGQLGAWELWDADSGMRASASEVKATYEGISLGGTHFWSPDGNKFFSGGLTDPVRISSISNINLFMDLKIGSYESKKFSPNSKFLAAIYNQISAVEGKVEVGSPHLFIALVSNLESNIQYYIKSEMNNIFDLDYSHDNQSVYILGFGHDRKWKVSQFSCQTGEKLKDVVLTNSYAINGSSKIIAVLRDEEIIIDEPEHQTMRSFSLLSGNSTGTIDKGRQESILKCIRNPLQNEIAVAMAENGLLLFIHLSNYLEISHSMEISHKLRDIKYSPNGDKLLAIGGHTTTLIDSQTKSIITNGGGVLAGIKNLAFGNSGSSLIAIDNDGQMRRWDNVSVNGQITHSALLETWHTPFRFQYLEKISTVSNGQCMLNLSGPSTSMTRHESINGPPLGLTAEGKVISINRPRNVANDSEKSYGQLSLGDETSDIFRIPDNWELKTRESGITPDGRWIILCIDYKENATHKSAVVMIDAMTGEIIDEIPHNFDQIVASDFSALPEAAVIVFSGKVHLWKRGDKSALQIDPVSVAGNPQFRSQQIAPAPIAISNDGNMLAIPLKSSLFPALNDGAIMIYSVSLGRILTVIHGGQSAVTALAFSPNQDLLAVGSFDGSVVVWKLNNSPVKLQMEFEVDARWLQATMITGTDRLLVISPQLIGKGTAWLFEPNTSNVPIAERFLPNRVTQQAGSTNLTTVTSSIFDKSYMGKTSIEILSSENLKTINNMNIELTSNNLSSSAFKTKEGKLLFPLGSSGIHIHSDIGEFESILPESKSDYYVEISDDGTTIVGWPSGTNKNIAIWSFAKNLKSPLVIPSVGGGPGAVSANGRTVVFQNAEDSFGIIDVSHNSIKNIPCQHKERIMKVHISRDGSHLISADISGRVVGYSIETEMSTFDILTHPEGLTGLDSNYDHSRFVTSGHTDNKVKIWSLKPTESNGSTSSYFYLLNHLFDFDFRKEIVIPRFHVNNFYRGRLESSNIIE